ncbi:RICIN domain-containing protein [Streptomyces sp. H10-C2]|uniref:RICIN domain-containing protein n=1 Tax=unclassified Streptomyces TaxID=2593676 RepID=UPI0024BB548E|nr:MULTISPECIES: RICIN domain-containing protein [unclassified Streptomyces]MDJ0347101.1 RICIN domain-containing protein [Streptomyces sp. PH10-H1]MDJ0375052.1 RICIN domain-containing protein [Streptomyces sp. H10-C2]
MRKRLVALAAVAAPLAALTLGVAPAHAATNWYGDVVEFSSGFSNYCLDIPNNQAFNGQHLQAWGCNGTDAQKWNVIYTDSYHFELQSKSNTSLCATNWQGGDVVGNDIRLGSCTRDADSTWNSVHYGSHMQIQPKSALNTCLNIWGGLTTGNPAKLYNCGDVTNENVWIMGVS